jgi:hypothetical protein
MNQGYIKLHRKIRETSFYRDSDAKAVALELLIEANHEPHRTVFNGKEFIVERGQLITGRLKLSQILGIPTSTIARKLQLLSNCGFLVSKPNNKWTLITICNYYTYQSYGNRESDIKPVNERLTNGQPVDTLKEVKKLKNYKNTTYVHSRFVKPTPDQVEAYAWTMRAKLDGTRFVDYYESKGWLVGKSPMKNWQAAVRTWLRNNTDVTAYQPSVGPELTEGERALANGEDMMTSDDIKAILTTIGDKRLKVV